jgi:2-hydroxychromene-2-carboxylate isomerase
VHVAAAAGNDDSALAHYRHAQSVRAGLRTRIQSDLAITHRSRGAFGPDYWYYAERFRGKFPDRPYLAHPGRPAFFESLLDDRDQVLRFQH